MVNILVPGNQWGKTLVTAIKHIYQNMHKLELAKFGVNDSDIERWMQANYNTLNFGKTYEIAKSVHEAVIQLINGEYELVDPKTGMIYMNESKLRGAIKRHSDSDLPFIQFQNGSTLLTRSTDDMGSSFKRRRLAFVSGDECGDIPNIISLLTVTLIPRVAFYKGHIDLVGTPQEPGEYQELVDLAEQQMDDYEEKAEYFIQRGTMYENPGLSKDHVAKIEQIADEDLRRRIVYGEFVETGDRYFQMIQLQQAVNEQLRWSMENPVIEMPQSEGWYVVSGDYAASSKDKTVIGVLRFDPNIKKARLVYLRFFKGKEVPLPMQYELTREVFAMYSQGAKCFLTFDGNSLGGKHAEAQLKDLHPYLFPEKGMSAADAKARALGFLKGLFDEGRRILEIQGRAIDVVSNWGGIEFPYIRQLKLELEGYKLEDSKIRNDMVMMLAMAAFVIARKKPKIGQQRVSSFNYLGATINQASNIYG